MTLYSTNIPENTMYTKNCTCRNYSNSAINNSNSTINSAQHPTAYQIDCDQNSKERLTRLNTLDRYSLPTRCDVTWNSAEESPDLFPKRDNAIILVPSFCRQSH
ncbi:hypothetical protein AVEN_136671-1 [Araneus ventricosus]|uniref:Uncharacterized protein n=1 Tax=Araneus ventricosus TaxID=182803 RepID=A0A4Y2VB91_ARAVE|nr:hypothetical protein AVEN_98104-1 [Araneus ventricosus]GBO21368.1 hypothetical protein AVEN_233273-1 [Araneus ventricosus]GBO21370.1 hypothetical protein AVEN_247277-1 [Araneus ventricosus]GBO21372.1 hypothetical protein AVEN_136671-1 [Araneus ventricosus]